MSSWIGATLQDLEAELQLDPADDVSGVFPLVRLREPRFDRPPVVVTMATRFGVWPPYYGPDDKPLRAVTHVTSFEGRSVIAVQSDGFPCAAVAETTHGAKRWYTWVLNPRAD